MLNDNFENKGIYGYEKSKMKKMNLQENKLKLEK